MNIKYALQDDHGYRWILSELGLGCNWQDMTCQAVRASVSDFRLIGVRMNEIWSIHVRYKVVFGSIRWQHVRIDQIRIHQRGIVKFESIGAWQLRIDHLRIDQVRVRPRSWSSNPSVRIPHHTLVRTHRLRIDQNGPGLRIHELRIDRLMISSNRLPSLGSYPCDSWLFESIAPKSFFVSMRTRTTSNR